MFKSHKIFCENKNFCGIVMSPENDITSKFNQYMRSDKMPQNVGPESSIKKNRWMCKHYRKTFNNKIR